MNRVLNHIAIYPASHYVTTKDKMDRAIGEIRKEMEEQVKVFTDNDQLVEAQRIRQRTEYDMEMMAELGYCSGIENYSRIISDRSAGSAPMTLLDFFPDDFVLFVDESHNYKNLFLYTKMRNVAGIAQSEAQKSSNFF